MVQNSVDFLVSGQYTESAAGIWANYVARTCPMIFTSKLYVCTIETQLRSFYFKLFHKVIAFNKFLHKIGRKDSPLCFFCDKVPETEVHNFCECEKVTTILNELQDWINDNLQAVLILISLNLCLG